MGNRAPWLVEPGCSTPTRTPVGTVSNHMENLTPSLYLAPKEKRKPATLEKLQEYLNFILF